MDSVRVVRGTVDRVAVDVVGASGLGRVSLVVEQAYRCPVELSAASHDAETEYRRHRLVVGYCGFVFADPRGAAWMVSPDRPELHARRGSAQSDSLAARVREIVEFYDHPSWRAPNPASSARAGQPCESASCTSFTEVGVHD